MYVGTWYLVLETKFQYEYISNMNMNTYRNYYQHGYCTQILTYGKCAHVHLHLIDTSIFYISLNSREPALKHISWRSHLVLVSLMVG